MSWHAANSLQQEATASTQAEEATTVRAKLQHAETSCSALKHVSFRRVFDTVQPKAADDGATVLHHIVKSCPYFTHSGTKNQRMMVTSDPMDIDGPYMVLLPFAKACCSSLKHAAAVQLAKACCSSLKHAAAVQLAKSMLQASCLSPKRAAAS
jgi:hypothetical protein